MAKKAAKFYDFIKKPGQGWKRVRWNKKYLHNDKTSKRIRSVAKRSGYKYKRLRAVPDPPLRVVSRAAWGARKTSLSPASWTTGTTAWVHHTVNAVRPGLGDMKGALMREMQGQHLAQGWSDIGYNYVIFPDGTVYEGRGYGKHGAHNPNHNSEPGIAFIGNFMVDEPSKAAMRAFGQLLEALKLEGEIRPHRATYATACPGDNLVSAMKRAYVSRFRA